MGLVEVILLELNATTGLLATVRYLLSPHHDMRPENMPVDMIVIHNISLPPGQFGTGSIEQFFCGNLDFTRHPYFSTIADLRVSSHLLIDRGGLVTQFVPFSKRAWHAGQSSFQGRTVCNDFSVGIELEGTDDTPYEAAQYRVLKDIIKLLMKSYPDITLERIVGHSDIAPGRKTDPGSAFDWVYLKSLL